jgi:histidinol-phosphate/aromatic aminotransferase/cobyric acid decarboxylase-like protein
MSKSANTRTNASRCRSSEPIYADCNQPGEKIVDYIPDLARLSWTDDRSFFAYASPNRNRGTIGEELRDALAEMEGVAPADLVVGGSGLALIRALPRAVGAEGVVKVAGDFVGYAHAAADAGLPLREAHFLPGDTVSAERVADAAADFAFPIIYLTFGPANPSQALTSLDTLKAVRRAVPRGVLVVNGAYAACVNPTKLGCSELAALARENMGVIYINVAAKSLGLCGARIAWACASGDLRATLSEIAGPYPIAPKSAEVTLAMLRRPDLVEALHRVMAVATSRLRRGLDDLGILNIAWPGHWSLAHFGDAASPLVERLAREEQIFLQDQRPLLRTLRGWVRISGTTPHEADEIIHALRNRIGPTEGAAPTPSPSGSPRAAAAYAVAETARLALAS